MSSAFPSLPSAESPATLVRAFAETDSGAPRPRESHQVLNAGPAGTLEEQQCRLVPHGKVGIGIYRINGQLYAVRNQCPHMGVPLCKGRLGATYLPKGAAPDPFEETLANRVLRCPWHGWEFDVATGKGLYDAKGRVPTYPVRVNPAQEIEVLI